MRSRPDRRDRVRCDPFGPFWGSLDIVEPVRVLDFSPAGAFIEVGQPLPVESVHPVKLTIAGRQTTCEARIKHIRAGPSGRYLAGIEFLVPFAGPLPNLGN